MTTMGLEYEKLLESRRHNYATEDISQQDVNVRKYTASFEPRRVAAQELSARAQKQNADTNTYTASFKPREVAAQEKQASASMTQAQAAVTNAETNRINAETNRLAYELDQAIRNSELTMKQIYNMEDIRVRDFQNETARTLALSNEALNKLKGQESYYKSMGTAGKLQAAADRAYEEAGGGFWGGVYGSTVGTAAGLIDIITDLF